jgi:hypothetical protein
MNITASAMPIIGQAFLLQSVEASAKATLEQMPIGRCLEPPELVKAVLDAFFAHLHVSLRSLLREAQTFAQKPVREYCSWPIIELHEATLQDDPVAFAHTLTCRDFRIIDVPSREMPGVETVPPKLQDRDL